MYQETEARLKVKIDRMETMLQSDRTDWGMVGREEERKRDYY